MSKSGFAAKVFLLLSFTPGFSQLTAFGNNRTKPSKRFPADSLSAKTWLKPGENEINNFAPVVSETQRQQLTYENDKATVTGRLVYRTFYGPPNYGETPKTDSRETQAILLLDSPIDVIANANDGISETERGVRAITLVSDRSLKSFAGKRVTVQGALFHAHTGHHHTKVLLTVAAVKRR